MNKIHDLEPRAQLQLLVLFPHIIFNKIHLFKKLLKIGICAINPIYSIVNDNLIQNAHEIGLKIYPWTINDRFKILEFKEMGVDGVITDYPDILNQEYLIPVYV